MATIPWFPGAGLLGEVVERRQARARSRAARRSTGIDVTHPRTLFVPRLAHATWGPLYAASIAPLLARYRGKVDVVLGSWAYPDGFAAVIAARLLGVPCVVKLHGSDINVDREAARAAPDDRRGRCRRRRASSRSAARSPTRSSRSACARERVAIVMNGVDGELFQPRDRAAARAELGLPRRGRSRSTSATSRRRRACSTSRRAWRRVARERPGRDARVVGGGPLRGALEAIVAPLGERVRLVGPQPLATIPTWMAAADLLVLPSHAEGTPNVVLEALACGRRVVATAVGGVPDLITERRRSATLVPPRDPDALAAALVRVAATRRTIPPRSRALGARGGWDASAAALHEVLVGAASASVTGRDEATAVSQIGDDWYESEEPTRAGDGHRAAAHPPPHARAAVPVLAARGAGHRRRHATRSRRRSGCSTPRSMLALHRGLAGAATRTGIPVGPAQRVRDLGAAARHEAARADRAAATCYPLRKQLGTQFALDELREQIEIAIWKNSFIYYDEEDANARKSARIGITVDGRRIPIARSRSRTTSRTIVIATHEARAPAR